MHTRELKIDMSTHEIVKRKSKRTRILTAASLVGVPLQKVASHNQGDTKSALGARLLSARIRAVVCVTGLRPESSLDSILADSRPRAIEYAKDVDQRNIANEAASVL